VLRNQAIFDTPHPIPAVGDGLLHRDFVSIVKKMGILFTQQAQRLHMLAKLHPEF